MKLASRAGTDQFTGGNAEPSASMARGPAGARRRTQDAVAILCLLFLGVVIPVVVSAAAGSLEIPRNDDWSYRRIALGLAQTGQLAFDGASQTMLIGQVLLAQPFLWVAGLQPWAFTAAGSLFAVAAVVSAYMLVRRLLPPRYATLATLPLIIFPGYLAYANSFMSDVPAMAGQFACLAMGATAMGRRPVPTRLVIGSLAIGVAAFSIRDFAVAAPATVAVVAILAEPRRLRHWALAGAVVGCCLALYAWRISLPGQVGDVTSELERTDGLSVVSISFVVAPAAIVAAVRWRHHWQLKDVSIGVALGLLLLMSFVVTWDPTRDFPPALLENLASQWGVPAEGYLVGGRPILIPDPAWSLVNVLALAMTVVALGVSTGVAGAHLRRCPPSLRVLRQRIGSPSGVLFIFVFAVAVGLTAYGIRWRVFDRYFWPVVPPVAALLLYVPSDLRRLTRSPGARRWTGPQVVAAAIGGVPATLALMYLLNSHAFDIARWQAGMRLVGSGIAPERVDAGYEWVGYHATTPARAGMPVPAEIWYRGWWPSFAPCGLVASKPQDPPARLVATSEYELYLIAGPTVPLYLYQLATPGCPPT